MFLSSVRRRFFGHVSSDDTKPSVKSDSWVEIDGDLSDNIGRMNSDSGLAHSESILQHTFKKTLTHSVKNKVHSHVDNAASLNH